MKIISNNEKIFDPTVLTLGSFDGLHKGHLFLLNQLKSVADKNGLKTAVMTFVPHPKIFFGSDKDFKLLNTIEEKIELFKKTNINYLILKDFNLKFAQQNPNDFIKKLKENYNMKMLLMGYDHNFGKDKKGDFAHIKNLEKKYNFIVKKIDVYTKNSKSFGSNDIRNLIKNGKMEEANDLLGYDFFITGKVISGNRIGNKLGFPTANIEVSDKNKIKPKQGVYIVSSIINNKKYYGMMNIGNRPTINGTKEVSEVHFFNFDKDIYEKVIQISFLKRLRNEQKFNSLNLLVEQLKKDKKKSIDWIKSNRQLQYKKHS